MVTSRLDLERFFRAIDDGTLPQIKGLVLQLEIGEVTLSTTSDLRIRVLGTSLELDLVSGLFLVADHLSLKVGDKVWMMFVPGATEIDGGQYIVLGRQSGNVCIAILGDVLSAFVRCSPESGLVEVTADSEIRLTAPVVTINAATSFAINSPSATINGVQISTEPDET